MITVKQTDIEGVFIIEPKLFGDKRGYFLETWSQEEWDEKIGPVRFVQDNESRSLHGVVRGLHYQRPPWSQAKLVRCLFGAVLDVAVDVRHGSPTFGCHVAVELTGENHRQLFLPRGMAHGFSVLSKEAVFQYKCDNPYRPQSEGGIDLFDPELGIDWRVPREEALLSDKDLRHPLLKDAPRDFEY